MELQTLDKKLPIKAIPEQELNKIVLMDFTPWLCKLLSLTGENAVDRLEMALPAIKEHCWSLGFDEIKKMFEMYVDNKLGIEPMDNYFTRALFGKIVSAYKNQRPVKKKNIVIEEISEAEKILKEKKGVLRCFDEYKSGEDISYGYVWVYDWLDEKGVLSFSKEKKIEQMAKARNQEKLKVDKSQAGAKNVLEMLEDKSSPKVINQAKRNLLKIYFDFVKENEFKNDVNLCK